MRSVSAPAAGGRGGAVAVGAGGGVGGVGGATIAGGVAGAAGAAGVEGGAAGGEAVGAGAAGEGVGDAAGADEAAAGGGAAESTANSSVFSSATPPVERGATASIFVVSRYRPSAALRGIGNANSLRHCPAVRVTTVSRDNSTVSLNRTIRVSFTSIGVGEVTEYWATSDARSPGFSTRRMTETWSSFSVGTAPRSVGASPCVCRRVAR